jgi:bifunctional non-homologous end joining protein LigD
MGEAERTIAKIGGRRLSLSNLEKDIYPSYGFTKAQVLEYYRHVARFMLPHLRSRALTLKRYPDGVEEEYFFEKRCPRGRPAWVKTAKIPLDKGEKMTVCLVNDLSTLVWVENLASIELHVPLARVASHTKADSMVFDLDPGKGADVVECARVALILKDMLLQSRLAAWVKTSGKKGLHLFVPLNRKEATFEDTKKFSKAVAEVLERGYPSLVTAKVAKEKRPKKVFINWSQNDASKTMVCVYSLRARKTPTVSFPLEWKEVEALAARGDPLRFEVTHSEALKRLERKGDLFREVLVRRQKLPYL